VIKCLVCKKRVALSDIQAGMTCTKCTSFLAKYSQEYKIGENIETYSARLSEVLDMKIGA